MPQRSNDCPNDPSMCRISVATQVKDPPIAWTPEYDGTGKMVNEDPNTYVTIYSCSVCDAQWMDEKTRDKVTTTVLQSPKNNRPGMRA
jgi:hypothetical protein